MRLKSRESEGVSEGRRRRKREEEEEKSWLLNQHFPEPGSAGDRPRPGSGKGWIVLPPSGLAKFGHELEKKAKVANLLGGPETSAVE